MEDIEVSVEDVVVEQFGLYFVFGVCERAELSVLAFVQSVRISRAKFLLVVIVVVQLFHFVVCHLAVISCVAVASLINLLYFAQMLAGIVRKIIARPLFVEVVVVVETLLVVVLSDHGVLLLLWGTFSS